MRDYRSKPKNNVSHYRSENSFSSIDSNLRDSSVKKPVDHEYSSKNYEVTKTPQNKYSRNSKPKRMDSSPGNFQFESCSKSARMSQF